MIKVIADSTCDLSKDLLEKYDISILPLHVLLGEKEYLDGKTITTDEIYKWSDEHKTTPKTSAPALPEAIELMKPYVEENRELICFSISDDMSMSGNVMRMAARELNAEHMVSVINSANLSTGIGLLVIEAAIMAEAGMDRKAIVARLEELIPLVRSSFVVDTLVYLHRGGRCSSVAALAGSALKLHPKIVVENGKMSASKKYRGKIDGVILSYVRDLEQELKKAKKDRVFITHSCCSDEVIAAVRAYLEQLNVFEEILVTGVGGVVASHCGPGTLGVLFIAQ